MSTSELAIKVKDLRELRRMSEEINAEIEAITDEIKQAMYERDADELTGPDYKITWREVTSTRFDSKAFRAAMPALYQQYSKPTTSRRFLLV